MKRWSAWLVPLFMACSSAPARSPDDAGDFEAGGDEPADIASEAENEGSAPGEEPAASAGSDDDATASPADLQTILQLVIDDEALTPYLHLEDPGRFPLKMAGSALPSGIELVKANKPVVFVDASEANDKKLAVLEVTELDVSGNRGTVTYRYDIEGVRGSATVVKSDGTWTLDKSRITERAVDLKR